ncbi:MAG: MurR/RpiR family transcriptional regulator [Lactimicrobium sp.]|jgi:DNA-binding MurR/RpiR family transcriptional regulator|uniref:MurR/RpiR family transcriptional regulator n=1 Tax=Lactimicrobium sp. TaxID=2563780 RepID=UPI002F35E0E0
MNIITRMDALVSSYTATDRRIYEYIKKFPDQFSSDSMTDIVKHYGISQPALTRFAKKLGFSGFLEFQYQYRQDLSEVRTNGNTETRSEHFSQYLQETEKGLDRNVLQQLAQKIMSSRLTYFTGASIAGIPAKYLEDYCRLGLGPVGVYSSPSSMPLAFTGEETVLLYSAIAGDAYRKYLPEISQSPNKPYIVMVTMNARHPLRKYADLTIVLPEAGIISDNTSAMPETMEFLMFSDLLIEEIRKVQEEGKD